MNQISENNFPYEDIVSLPHHVSDKHPRMAVSDRAAQFAPFAALTGHEEAIDETGKRTDVDDFLHYVAAHPDI